MRNFSASVSALFIAMFTAAAAKCWAADKQTICPPHAGDAAAVMQTLQTMLDAFAKDDLRAFHLSTEPGFYAYDGGRRLDGDTLINLILAAHAKGDLYIWTIEQPSVHVDCNTAWVTYVDRGAITIRGGETKSIVSLESAILSQHHGRWKILFLQSTPASLNKPSNRNTMSSSTAQ